MGWRDLRHTVHVVNEPEKLAMAIGMTSLGRLGQPEDFTLSNAAFYPAREEAPSMRPPSTQGSGWSASSPTNWRPRSG